MDPGWLRRLDAYVTDRVKELSKGYQRLVTRISSFLDGVPVHKEVFG